LNRSLAAEPARSTMRANPAVVKGALRSEVNTKGGPGLLLALEPPQRRQFAAEDRMRHKPFDLRLRQVFTGPELGVGEPRRRNCSF